MLSSNELAPVGLDGALAAKLSAPKTAHTAALLELWQSKSKDGLLPWRSDVSPCEMKDYLEYVYIIEVIDEGADFLVRLAGTALTGRFGYDFTGVKFSDERLKGAEWRLEIFKSAFETLAPVMYRYSLGSGDGPHITTENLILPVRDKDDDHIILLCVSILVDDTEKPVPESE